MRRDAEDERAHEPGEARVSGARNGVEHDAPAPERAAAPRRRASPPPPSILDPASFARGFDAGLGAAFFGAEDVPNRLLDDDGAQDDLPQTAAKPKPSVCPRVTLTVALPVALRACVLLPLAPHVATVDAAGEAKEPRGPAADAATAGAGSVTSARAQPPSRAMATHPLVSGSGSTVLGPGGPGSP